MRREPDCGCSHKAASREWMERLRGEAGRVTQSRRAVLDALMKLGRPSTPREVADALENRTCDLATVYRSLGLFQQMDLVQRVDFGDGVARFEIADDGGGGHHHHHLVCRDCRKIVKLDQCILAGLEAELERQFGFRKVSHRLEFFGVCPQCQVQPGRPE